MTSDMPETALDFAACTRIVLTEMAIPHGIVPSGASEDAEATLGQRLYLGNPAVVVIVVVGLSEIVLEAGAYTILFAVTVKVVDKAVDDVAEALKKKRNKWRDECAQRYSDCMDTPVGDQSGNTWKQTLCGICAASCDTNKTWPSNVGNGSCEYWKRGWGPQ